ncbi:hypothetical protein MD484_g1012, partial [Candolleomyces efflorescens]
MNSCSSILSKLLSSNLPPEPLERGPLQAEVDRLKSKALSLRAQLQECEELLQKHQTVLSIVRKISLDVWGIVFSFVLPDCSTREDWQELLNLSLVCKDWHQAVQFAHRFSTHLKIEDCELDYGKAMSRLRRATEGRTLEIVVTWPCKFHHDPKEGGSIISRPDGRGGECVFSTPALLRLMTEGPVLDSLSFHGVSPPCYQDLLNHIATSDLASSPWGSLTKFAVYFGSVWNQSPVFGPESIAVPPRITSLRFKLPNPKSFRIEAHSLPLLIQPSILERLTTFSLEWRWSEFDATMLLNALPHCANLDTLVLNFGDCSWSCKDGPKAVLLPKLRELQLTECEDSLKFLNFIDAPRLVCLNLHIGTATRPDDLSSFITKQFARSQGALYVTLRVFRSFFSNWDIPDFLQHVPHIARLILDGCVSMPEDEEDPDFFQDLNSYCKHSLSDLKVLEIFGLPREFPIGWVEDYIFSRRKERADDGLKTVVVKYDPDGMSDSESGSVKSLKPVKRIVKRMRNTGVSFSVEYS